MKTIKQLKAEIEKRIKFIMKKIEPHIFPSHLARKIDPKVIRLKAQLKQSEDILKLIDIRLKRCIENKLFKEGKGYNNICGVMLEELKSKIEGKNE